jgi:hypothetical protein
MEGGQGEDVIGFKIVHVMTPMLTAYGMRSHVKGGNLPVLDGCGMTMVRLSTAMSNALEHLLAACDSTYSVETFTSTAAAAATTTTTTHKKGTPHGKDPSSSKVDVGRGSFAVPEASDGEDDEDQEQGEAGWARACARILTRLKKHPEAGPFLVPVDPETMVRFRLHLCARRHSCLSCTSLHLAGPTLLFCTDHPACTRIHTRKLCRNCSYCTHALALDVTRAPQQSTGGARLP